MGWWAFSKPKKLCGLDFRDLSCFNQSILTKVHFEIVVVDKKNCLYYMIKYVIDLKKKIAWCMVNFGVGVFILFYLIKKIDMFNQWDWAKLLDLS